MKRYASKLTGMQVFRATGRPRLLPLSVAYSVTHKCNARCKTCGLGANGAPGVEMDSAEWMRVFKSLGNSPMWLTVTGGEPFLRPDLMELSRAMIDSADPRLVTIVTNGSMPDKASLLAPLLAREYPQTRFVVNISIDGIGPAHDRIRNLDGIFDSALETFHLLKRKQPKNLYVGFHTTISKFNVSSIKDLAVYLREFQPDAHVFEAAHPRAELNMQGTSVAPSAQQYRELLPRLKKAAIGGGLKSSLRKARFITRDRYYDLSLSALEKKRQPLPCYAGFASAQIGPAGDVWPCCSLASPMGNLRDSNFNFMKIWHSPEATAVRAPIAAGKCSCPMANALMTSMMFDPASIGALSGKFISSLFG